MFSCTGVQEPDRDGGKEDGKAGNLLQQFPPRRRCCRCGLAMKCGEALWQAPSPVFSAGRTNDEHFMHGITETEARGSAVRKVVERVVSVLLGL